MTPLAKLLSLPVRAYRLIGSPWVGHGCRFQPTCSAYAMEALERHGGVKGGALAFWRVLRCNPWGGSGYDPVPGQTEKGASASRVYLDGYIDVPPERLDAVRAALPDHLALTRAEPGCLRFDVEESAEHPGRFTVSEVFESQAAFDAHQMRAKSTIWAEVTAGIPRNYDIRNEDA